MIIVYRNLNLNDNIANGLSARKPGRDMSPSGHIMNGSKSSFKGSQYISTTTDPAVAKKWAQIGIDTVYFDTDDVIPDSKGNLSIIDVSTPEKAKALGLKGRSYSNAISSREVLIEGYIPSNKIKKVCN